MPWTAHLANKYLDQAFRNVNYSRATTLHLALFTAMPNAGSGSGITGTEVSGGGYSRVAVVATAAANNFHNGSDLAMSPGESLTNKNVITWARPTSDWGTVVAYGLVDAASGGNLLLYEALPAPQTLDAFNRPNFAAAALQFTIGGACGDYLEASILNHLLRGVAFPTIHSGARLMLGTGAGAANAFAAEITPSTDGDATPNPTSAYSRLAMSSAYWGAAAGGTLVNTAAATVTFGTAFPGATLSHWGLILDSSANFNDTPAAGNMLWHGALANTVIIPANAGSVSNFSFNIGDLVLGFEI